MTNFDSKDLNNEHNQSIYSDGQAWAHLLPSSPSARGARSMQDKNLHALVSSATEDVVNTVSGRGGDLTESDVEALRYLQGAFTCIAASDKAPDKALAIPLPMGMGKTQSVVSWCGAVHKHRAEFSVLICGELLDELSKLKGDLIGKGIPEESVGFIHSGKEGLSKSASGNPEDYQFLLVTHERIRSADDISKYNKYWGKERSLCIWDESLIRNTGHFIVAEDLREALRDAQGRLDDDHSSVPQDRNARQELTVLLSSLHTIIQEVSRLEKIHRTVSGAGKTMAPSRLRQKERCTLLP